MATRAHLYQTIINATGEVQIGATVRILKPRARGNDGQFVADEPLAATLYTDIDPDYSTVSPSIVIVTTGVLDLWLDLSQYVRLGITPVDGTEYFIDGVGAFTPDTVPVDPGGGGGGTGGVVGGIMLTKGSPGAPWDTTDPLGLFGDISWWSGVNGADPDIALVDPGVYIASASFNALFDGDPGRVDAFGPGTLSGRGGNVENLNIVPAIDGAPEVRYGTANGGVLNVSLTQIDFRLAWENGAVNLDTYSAYMMITRLGDN